MGNDAELGSNHFKHSADMSREFVKIVSLQPHFKVSFDYGTMLHNFCPSVAIQCGYRVPTNLFTLGHFKVSSLLIKVSRQNKCKVISKMPRDVGG